MSNQKDFRPATMFPGALKAPQVEQGALQLIVTWDPKTGDINVTGNIMQNRLICFGMLDLAKEALTAFSMKQAQASMMPRPGEAPPDLKGPDSH